AILKWARGTAGGRIVLHNVVADVDRPTKPKGRKRVLSDNELASIWSAAATLEPVWEAFFRLAILTGKRRSEICRMAWPELRRDTGEWLIPGERTKNGVDDLLSLPSSATDILDKLAVANLAQDQVGDEIKWPTCGFVLTASGNVPIGAHSKAKKCLDAAIAELRGGVPLEHWVVHDLRRTFATGLQRLGTRMEVTEAALNHTGVSRAGVAGIYQRYDWATEKRDALKNWAQHVAMITEGPHVTNVVALRPR
ncbi:MAG: integrase, partial [Sphingobacteriales bacterium]